MTPAELPAYIRRVRGAIQERAPLDAADAMAASYQNDVRRSMKGSSPSAPGTPPARRTGTLARSVVQEAAVSSGAGRARSSVAPHTVYARIQQLGGTIVPVRAKVLRWTDKGGTHYARKVTLPARPYMVMTSARRDLGHSAAVAAVRRAVQEALGG